MKGYTTAVALTLLVGVAGAASATEAVIDFRDATKNAHAKVADAADGKLTNVEQGKLKGVQTSGTTSTEGYLYIDVEDGLFKAGSALYVDVQYYSNGTDTFGVEYNAEVTDADGNKSDQADAVANPANKPKSGSGRWTDQVFTLAGVKFNGGLPGKGDVTITDLGDGPEIIGKVVISDVNPLSPNLPKVDPAKPIVIDGVKKDGEWDGAYTIELNAPEFDAILGAPNWKGPEDFDGKYSFKWDAKGLYILGEVLDDVPFMNDKEQAADCYCSGDGIEVYIGFDQSNPSRRDYLAETDFQVITALGQKPRRAIHHGASGVDTQDLGVVPLSDLVLTKTEKGYLFEYLIRWELLKPGVTVADGQKIGFNMFGNDGDDASAQETAMTPYKGVSMWKDPSAWVTATLSPKLTVENPPAAGN